MARSKYGNRKVEVDGYKFDSVAESLRYQELKLMEYAGEIVELKPPHPKYLLQEGFMCDGKRVQPVYYIADFEYVDSITGELITEDVKGVETAVFRLKHKLFMRRYKRAIRLVRAR
jgi:hypothetical protein